MSKFNLYKVILAVASEIIVGTMAIVVCLSLLVNYFHTALASFDSSITHTVYMFRSESMTVAMKFITFLGGEIFVTLGVLLFFLLLYQKHKRSAFDFAFILVFGIALNYFLKYVFARPRPDYLPLAFESTYSFPSGHAMNSFIFYSCIAYFILRNTKKTSHRWLTIGLFILLVVLIGISRVYLGVHYPSDVIAGYIAGGLWFALVVIVERTAIKFKLLK